MNFGYWTKLYTAANEGREASKSEKLLDTCAKGVLQCSRLPNGCAGAAGS
jgi:hypothetical protein